MGSMVGKRVLLVCKVRIRNGARAFATSRTPGSGEDTRAPPQLCFWSGLSAGFSHAGSATEQILLSSNRHSCVSAREAAAVRKQICFSAPGAGKHDVSRATAAQK